MRINVDTTHHDFLFLGYDAGDIINDSNIIITNDAQGDGLL